MLDTHAQTYGRAIGAHSHATEESALEKPAPIFVMEPLTIGRETITFEPNSDHTYLMVFCSLAARMRLATASMPELLFWRGELTWAELFDEIAREFASTATTQQNKREGVIKRAYEYLIAHHSKWLEDALFTAVSHPHKDGFIQPDATDGWIDQNAEEAPNFGDVFDDENRVVPDTAAMATTQGKKQVSRKRQKLARKAGTARRR